MLTSVTSKTQLDFAERVGTALLPVDAFVEKPVKPSEMLATIESVLAARRPGPAEGPDAASGRSRPRPDGDGGQGEDEAGPVAGLRLRPDASAVPLDDLLRDEEPEPGPRPGVAPVVRSARTGGRAARRRPGAKPAPSFQTLTR